ncbi:hypothetical protein C0992_008732 [Termitomyces sp. T32_za158]|nr:hypothetical protein C0992_008732 [Termitomyces sp. T32_za158]
MKQGKTDAWTLGTGTPSVITSTFKLPMVEGRSPSIDTYPFVSRRCGLGWVYNIQATNADATQSFMESGKRTMFKISFDAPFVATTNLDKLSITVKATDKPSPDKASLGAKTVADASKLIVHVSDISLPVSQSIAIASIVSIANFTGNILVQIRVELWGSPTFEHAFRGPTPQNLSLHSVVAQTLLGKGFDDVKFGLFNRRGGNDVMDPNVLFVNRSLSHGHNAFLLKLLSEDNMEGESVAFGDLAAQSYSAYDYMSDSDLEGDDETDTDDCIDLDSPAASLWGEECTTRPKKDQFVHRDLDKDEQIILIRDIAFATFVLPSVFLEYTESIYRWKALVFYLYTQEIHFKPLRSDASRNVEASGHGIACSPKSMYRLATKIGLEELQELSLEAIIHSISEENIIEELFSKFTSMSVSIFVICADGLLRLFVRYPVVQEAEVRALKSLLGKSDVSKNLADKMESAVTKGLPHCGPVVRRVVGLVQM